MNKSQLIDKISDATGDNRATVTRNLNAALGILASEMAAQKTVTLNGFGTFFGAMRNRQTYRNPQNGDKVICDPKLAFKFKPSKSIGKAVA